MSVVVPGVINIIIYPDAGMRLKVKNTQISISKAFDGKSRVSENMGLRRRRIQQVSLKVDPRENFVSFTF